MSLVGSLEDLGLGDILQIISLSRKSGLLLLRSEEGEGRISFYDGLVRAAFVKGEVDDLRGLLVGGGFVEEHAFDKAAEMASAHGDPLDDVLATTSAISKERIDSLRREQVERSVFRMFAWTVGEFSFEIRDEIDDRDRDLLLTTGINAQYLTMEATRLGDEDGHDQDDDIQFGTIDEDFAEVAAAGTESSTEEPAGDAVIADAIAMAVVERADEAESDDVNDSTMQLDVQPDVEREPEPEPETTELVETEEPADAVAAMVDEPSVVTLPAAESADVGEAVALVEPETAPPVSEAESQPVDLTALILIDPDLAALEWQKSVLGPICRRIHIFQRPDSGISRLRQYLRRGEEPVVLVADDLPPDPHAGIDGSLELIGRLRAHAPRMPIYLVKAGAEGAPPSLGAANGLLERPADHQLANRRAWSKLEGAGETLRNALLDRSRLVLDAASDGRARGAAEEAKSAQGQADANNDLKRLKRTSERLRDPSVRGEVLSLILEFAAELFSRVAIFMVRDDDVIGMAQSGLPRAGGPDDEAFREISFAASEPQCFRDVLERSEGIHAQPQDDGDRRLASLLGDSLPEATYVAPIESGHRVVALIYADNLPDNAPIGDTTSLEIVLHEASLALERALLERALADAE